MRRGRASPPGVMEGTAPRSGFADFRANMVWHRSHAPLSWFAARADFMIVFDNSDSEPGTPPAVLAVKFPGQPSRHLRRGVNPAVDAALDAMAGEAAH